MEEFDFYIVKPKSKEEWLEHRTKGLTGTDLSGIMGKNKYVSPEQVYLNKTNPEPYKELDYNNLPEGVSIQEMESQLAMMQGKVFEPYIANMFSAHTGLKYVDWFDPTTDCLFVNKDEPLFMGTPDRVVIHPEYGLGVLEIKTTFGYGQNNWKNGPPEMYNMQLQHYLGLSKHFKWGVMAAMINRKIEFINVAKDEKLIADMKKAGREFWEYHVLPINPPIADSFSSEKEVAVTENATVATEFDIDDWDRLQELKVRSKQIEEEIDAIKASLKMSIGDNKFLTDSSGKVLCYYNTQERTTFNDKQFKIDNPDIYDKYVVQKTIQVFETGRRRKGHDK